MAPAVAAIKKQIQYLHKHILDERLELNDPEIQRTYDLFVQTWQAGKDGMASSDEMVKAQYGENLPYPCQVQNDYWSGAPFAEEEQLVRDDKYTVRAWMAVLSYMLTDYQFVYE